MKVKIRNAYSDILFATREERDYIRDLCTIESISMFTKRGQLHPTEYKKKTPYIKDNKIPTGLLPMLVSAGVDIECQDSREAAGELLCGSQSLNFTCPKPIRSDADYSFQEDCIEKAIKYGRGLIHIPTGGGKTIVMCKLINELQHKTIVVVPDVNLLNQTYNNFVKYFGENVLGLLGDKNQKNLDNYSILVATQQTLYSYLKSDPELFARIIKDVGCLLIDECHHVAEADTKPKKTKAGKPTKSSLANSWWKVAMNIPAYYRFGFSATLNTKDSPNNQFVLESATGRVVYSISVSELIKRKVLVPQDTTMVNRLAVPCRGWKTMYYPVPKNAPDDYEKRVKQVGSFDVNIISYERNQLLSDMTQYLHKLGRNVLVLVDLVEKHGKVLADIIPSSIFIHGIHSKDERNEGFEQFIKENKILISTIVKEGFDVPAIDAIVIAGGGKAHGALIQKLGRGRRVFIDKHNCLVYDIRDNDGLTKKGEPKLLLRHSNERQEIYESVEEDTFRIITEEEFYAEVANA